MTKPCKVISIIVTLLIITTLNGCTPVLSDSTNPGEPMTDSSSVLKESLSAPTISPTKRPAFTSSPVHNVTENNPTENINDFFSDEARREKYDKYIESYKYEELLLLVDEYTNTNNPGQSDSAYAIKEITQQIVGFLGNCVVTYDEFDEKYTVYYRGVEAISKSINAVSFIDDDGMDRCIVGFKKSDWLFFDRIEIKVGTDDYISSRWDGFDITREVIDGGIIEYTKASFSDEEIEKIISATEPVIRFSNDEDGYYDHKFTEDEIKAMEACYKIREGYVQLSNMLYAWENK